MSIQSEIQTQKVKTWFKDDFCATIGRSIWLDGVIIAAGLIWGGTVLFANNLGILETLYEGYSLTGWSLFTFGAGILMLVEFGVRLLVPAFRIDVLGTLIGAGFVFLIGGWWVMLSAILIALGVIVLFRLKLGDDRDEAWEL
jgi:hypothetical protein